MPKKDNPNEISGLKLFWSGFNERGVILVLLGLCLILSIVTPNFRSVTNIINITRQISELSIAAIGMTYVIIAAEIDLSIGSIYGLCAMITGKLLANNVPISLSIIIAIIAGALIGLFNGTITTKLRVPAFIVTLKYFCLGYLVIIYFMEHFPPSYSEFLEF